MQSKVRFEESSKPNKSIKKTKHQSSESDQFQLEYHQIKKLGLPVNKKKLRIGNWEFEQNIIYLKFLQQNRSDFVSEPQRRKNKVFYRLSKILKKRTPDQCRSHHQKLQMKYQDNIDEIIDSIRKKLSKKSPHLFQQETKKIDLSKEKTGLIDTIQQKQQNQIVVDQGSFYRLLQNGQNTFQIEINLDQIQQWS